MSKDSQFHEFPFLSVRPVCLLATVSSYTYLIIFPKAATGKAKEDSLNLPLLSLPKAVLISIFTTFSKPSPPLSKS